ncbi:hypothetical protein IT401_01470 [Candidatus Nomurabacteria bacterium]|nr:hypothetical protein [Candidatus Nomurabacteria bacterium]
MENNNIHNLTTQFVQESKSLWRIKKLYIKDAKSKEVKAFWTKLAKEKESHLKDLKKFLKTELK